jgi:hypothetical protein
MIFIYLAIPSTATRWSNSWHRQFVYANDVLYGAEYETSSSTKPSGLDNLYEKDVPCSVCRRKGKSSVLMIPGKGF